jgi:hypothetical protein
LEIPSKINFKYEIFFLAFISTSLFKNKSNDLKFSKENYLIKKLEENSTYDNIVRARPSCIIGLDNEFLSREMISNINSNFFIFNLRKISK